MATARSAASVIAAADHVVEPAVLRTDPRTPLGWVTVARASRHNLRDVTIDVPLGVLTVVSGVAGSGKSTLFVRELPRQHPAFVAVDQTPLRGGVRSTPLTVLRIAEAVRQAYSAATGLAPSWFSANALGACPACRGKGFLVTDLAFLDDVRTPCDACAGTRFNATAREATLRGRTIADLLG